MLFYILLGIIISLFFSFYIIPYNSKYFFTTFINLFYYLLYLLTMNTSASHDKDNSITVRRDYSSIYYSS